LEFSFPIQFSGNVFIIVYCAPSGSNLLAYIKIELTPKSVGEYTLRRRGKTSIFLCGLLILAMEICGINILFS
jgi:hypothetical protein